MSMNNYLIIIGSDLVLQAKELGVEFKDFFESNEGELFKLPNNIFYMTSMKDRKTIFDELNKVAKFNYIIISDVNGRLWYGLDKILPKTVKITLH